MQFESKPFLNRTSEKELINRITTDLERLGELAQARLTLVTEYGVENKDKMIEVLMDSLEEAERVVTENIEYFKKKYIELDSAVEQIYKDDSMIDTLLESLEVTNKQLKERESLLVNEKMKNVSLEQALEKAKKVEELFELVERNSKSIAVSERIKNKTVKVDNKKKIDENKLVELYNTLKEDGTNKYTNEEIGRQVGLSGAGVKERLVSLGVYRGKRKDFGLRR